MDDDSQSVEPAAEQEARRAFLARCGRFAAVTPPAIATLLAVSSVPKVAHASTIGRAGGSHDRDDGQRMGLFKQLLTGLFG